MRKRIRTRRLLLWQTPELDTSGSHGIPQIRSITYYWAAGQAIKAGGFLQEGNRVAQFPALFRKQYTRKISAADDPVREDIATGQQNWSGQGCETVAENLDADLTDGLTDVQASHRLDRYGPNMLPEHRGRSIGQLLLAQINDAMILLLLAAAVVAASIGEVRDSLMIAAILLINAAIGIFHEIRAQKAMAALKLMVPDDVIVVRSGTSRTCHARDLVPGDLVQIDAGSRVPADMRLTATSDLQLDESALTGESLPTQKTVQIITGDNLPLGDQTNMAFSGTSVTRGSAIGLVVATGSRSEIGKIAGLMERQTPTPTPLQQRLTTVSRKLAIAAIIVCIIIFATGILQGHPPLLMFMTAASVAVAAMPESLPAVVTVLLAIGARKMARHNALIRRLPAVETLGSVTYICTDKTGTLTQNKMHVVEAVSDNEPEMLRSMALCNEVESDGTEGPRGEPTELALALHAREMGYKRKELEASHPREKTFAFSSERKRMTTVHGSLSGGFVSYTKGAPEVVLASSRQWQEKAEALAAKGMRVLAFARRETDEILESDDVGPAMQILGLVGLQDPPRDESAAAVAACRSAGIEPVMITGDHPQTALAIAVKIGLAEASDHVITGAELSDLDESEFAARVLFSKIYARVDPAQKIRIVEALQNQKQYVAMTGDGVNDAPALAAAEIGVAMGEGGTDVAREAADLILLDDNFSSIVAAVREGRRVFDNIRKFIRYILACNLAEVLTIFFAPLLGLPLPLLPLQILWINLVTDGLPGLALAAEKAEPDIMARPPVPPTQGLFDRNMWLHIIIFGAFMAAVTLAVQYEALADGNENWQTMVFTILTFLQLGQAFAVRSEKRSVFFTNPFENPFLVGAVLASAALHLLIIYTPVGQSLFNTAPLSARDLGICLVASLAGLMLSELWKLFRWRLKPALVKPR